MDSFVRHEALEEVDYSYRPATSSDAEAIVLVVDQAMAAGRGEPIPTYVLNLDVVNRTKELLQKSSTWSRLVFDGDKLVGCAIGYPSKDEKTGDAIPNREHLDTLMVVPGYWSKGIGGDLLDWTAGELLARSIQSIDLWTGSDNQRARSLYERKGYHITGEERVHPLRGDHQVQYELNLK